MKYQLTIKTNNREKNLLNLSRLLDLDINLTELLTKDMTNYEIAKFLKQTLTNDFEIKTEII